MRNLRDSRPTNLKLVDYRCEVSYSSALINKGRLEKWTPAGSTVVTGHHSATVGTRVRSAHFSLQTESGPSTFIHMCCIPVDRSGDVRGEVRSLHNC